MFVGYCLDARGRQRRLLVIVLSPGSRTVLSVSWFALIGTGITARCDAMGALSMSVFVFAVGVDTVFLVVRYLVGRWCAWTTDIAF